MQNFGPLSPYVTVSHFFDYTPPSCASRQKVTFSFLKTTNNNLHILYNWHGLNRYKTNNMFKDL